MDNPKQSTAYDLVKQKVQDMEHDAEAFYTKGNKAAGTRLRAGMQDLKNLAQDCRNDVTAKKNG